jgi:hypothetical protein
MCSAKSAPETCSLNALSGWLLDPELGLVTPVCALNQDLAGGFSRQVAVFGLIVTPTALVQCRPALPSSFRFSLIRGARGRGAQRTGRDRCRRDARQAALPRASPAAGARAEASRPHGHELKQAGRTNLKRRAAPRQDDPPTAAGSCPFVLKEAQWYLLFV